MTFRPDPGWRWLFMVGLVGHVTGTETQVIIYEGKPPASLPDIINMSSKMVFQKIIASTVDSANIPLFETNTTAGRTDLHPAILVIDNNQGIILNGHANSYLHLLVIEFKEE